jgi:hypothetical protein
MNQRSASPSVALLVTRRGMGEAEPALQERLLRTYLTLLLENRTLPGVICFYTEGVRLVVDDSPFLDLLKQLEERGVHLVVCKTCLDHFGIADRLRVGIIGGMGDILAAQWKADKVITI